MYAVFRLLHTLLGMLLLLSAGVASAQTTYIFDGRAIPNCRIAGTDYVCTSIPLSHYQDKVEILNGWKVISDTAIVFGYEQGLKMSGTARLVSYRDIDISNIQTSLLNITGGSFLSDQTFRMGAQSQNITMGHIKADNIYLGTGSTGSVTATIEAVRTITIAHGMTLTGNITKAIDVSVQASSGLVNGNITATGTVYLGSTARVNGSVIADTLSTQSSSAYVSGDATVRLAILEHAGRVAGKIYCTRGNAAGSCDCVINNSGSPINTAAGPNCPAMARTGANHIRIEHPTTGATCMPATVTLKACANAACSSLYTGGETVTLEPGSGTFVIGASGVRSDATVAQSTPGVATIKLNQVPVLPYACAGNGVTAANDCKINFANSALIVTVPNHRSEVSTAFTVKAVKSSANNDSCVPAISGNQNVTFKCIYGSPASGTRALRINGTPLNATGNALASCDIGGRTLSMNFDATTGTAAGALLYADAGSLSLSAAVAAPSMTGSATFVAAPASFTIARSGSTADKIKAGEGVAITVTARNAIGAITPNFTGSTLEAAIAPKRCNPTTLNGKLTYVDPSFAVKDFTLVRGFSGGVHGVMPPASPATIPRWSEAGLIDLEASMAEYLGYVVAITGNSNQTGTACTNNAGVFKYVPHHFDTAVTQPATFNYSGQPISTITVTAKNSDNQTTLHYTGGTARDVTLSAVDDAGIASTLGAMSNATILASKFSAGAASTTTALYTFTNKLTAPTRIRVRAVDTDAVSSSTAGEGQALIRSGRLRLFSAFGRAGAPLAIPYRVEYWTGSSWLTNLQHTTAFLANAVALTPGTGMSGAKVTSVTAASGAQAGQGTILLTPPARTASTGVGSVGVAVNLGSLTADNSCLADHPTTTGAAQPWLRSTNSNCAASDPFTRATFGVIAPEHRRVIHVREVFR